MGILVIGAWLGLLVLTMLPGKSDPRRVGMWFMLALPLLFLGHWFAARLTIPLLVWLFILGDRNHWFWDRGEPIVTGCFAAIMTSIVAARVMFRQAGARYAAVNCLGASALLLLMLTWQVVRFIDQIEGWTAESAAQAVISESYLSGTTIQLVREPTEESYPTDRCITYRGEDASGPRCRVTVCRHGMWWWKRVAWHGFPHRQQEMARAKKWLAERQPHTHLILEEIVKNYPGTEEAKEAKQLLGRE